MGDTWFNGRIFSRTAGFGRSVSGVCLTDRTDRSDLITKDEPPAEQH